MQVERAERDGAVVLRVRGAIDSTTGPDFEAALMEALGGGAGRLVLDVGQVEYVASAGLRVFLMAAKKAKAAGGRFVVCGMTEAVHRVFQLSGFLKIFTIVADEAEALSA